MPTSYVFLNKFPKIQQGQGGPGPSSPPPLAAPPACRVVSSKVVGIFKKMIRPPAS